MGCDIRVIASGKYDAQADGAANVHAIDDADYIAGSSVVNCHLYAAITKTSLNTDNLVVVHSGPEDELSAGGIARLIGCHIHGEADSTTSGTKQILRHLDDGTGGFYVYGCDVDLTNAIGVKKYSSVTTS